ncbi:MAG: hypothetical protein N3A72_02400 [bacterium]|nr:hypothetical protein [bacterium]
MNAGLLKLYPLILIGAIVSPLHMVAVARTGQIPGFEFSPYFQEQVKSYTFDTDVNIVINAPAENRFNPKRPIKLILYFLPNGNTIEHTIGKKLKPGDDWHYNIQHIGAQTRRLREVITKENIIVAYLTPTFRSWPSWSATHKENRNQLVLQILDSVTSQLPRPPDEVILSSHSGGGSFIFNYLNSVECIPDWITRIAFLDSVYNYNDEENKHGEKLIEWLTRKPNHYLSIISYDDRNIMLDGKLVVGSTGGTYRKTYKLIERFQQEIPLTVSSTGDYLRWRGLNGQVDIIIHPNPENKILHTVLVEKNGFIHAITVGTKFENKAGVFWGPVAYTKWIQED